tara:strand:+ start:157 stop:378 length:222 start_codon:yes stop_codon:yes gene_type:complete
VCFEESPKKEIGEKKCVANKTPLQNKGKKREEKEKKLRRCSAHCEDESIADDGTKKTALESESVFIRHRWHAL